MNNTVSCDHLDGNCLCKSGWTGKTCNEKVKEPCLPGRYGENCEEMCECMTNTTRRCDQFNGTCYCDIGWTGTDCSEPIVDGFEQTGDSTNSVAIAVVVIVLVGVIAVIVFVVLFIILRRRKANGKQIFWRFCRGRRHSNSDGGAADVDDTIQYANIVSSTSEEETSNQTGSKLAVYAVVDKKKHGKKTEALDKEMHDDLTATESGKGRLDNKSETEGAADVSNSPQALDLTYNEVDRTGKLYRPNTAGSDVGYDSLKPDVSEGIADYTSCPREQLDDDNRYDGLDRTGKAYRPERVTMTTDSEYDRLTAEDSVNPGTTDEYSIAAEPGMVDEYSSIDRTGKDYRSDTETNYDKLRMN
ncbi:uncharacterized protein [Ptychodera flava]|uniref:uncharacterized protein n=1 Tax=Ptychodera flava TaxID=63121 RepID=UPI003969E32F